MAWQDCRPHYTGIRFDGTNFDSWQFGVRLVLESEELWNIVKGNEVKPQPVSQFCPRLKIMSVSHDVSEVENFSFLDDSSFVSGLVSQNGFSKSYFLSITCKFFVININQYSCDAAPRNRI